MPDTAMPARRPPQRSNDPEGLRRKVMDVAAALFQSNGYNATTMKDLLREAGVSGGAVYHHFPSKKACGLSVIRERVAPAVRETWIVPIEKAPSTMSGIKNVMTQIADDLDDAQRVRGCPLNNLTLELSLADAEYREEIAAIFKAWQDAIATKLRADIAAGKLNPMDTGAFATFVVSAYSGAMAIAKAEQSTRALRATEKQLLAILAVFETK